MANCRVGGSIPCRALLIVTESKSVYPHFLRTYNNNNIADLALVGVAKKGENIHPIDCAVP